MGKVAIIDLGTNTFHLLISSIEKKKPVKIYDIKTPVQIGKGGISQGFIQKDALQRAIVALKEFKDKIDHTNVQATYAFATSAFRNAKNGKEAALKIKSATGLDIDIITGDTEAKYIYLGVKTALKMGKKKSLIIDIGGGSVEFIIANENQIFWKQSFEIGGQRLMDKFHQHDPITQSQIDDLNTFLDEKLMTLHQEIDLHQPQSLIGAAGAFDTISEIYCQKKLLAYEPLLGETPMDITSFEPLLKEFVMAPLETREKIPGMIAMRAGMIVVASLLIKNIMSQHLFAEMRVSSHSLKEGVLSLLIKKQEETIQQKKH